MDLDLYVSNSKKLRSIPFVNPRTGNSLEVFTDKLLDSVTNDAFPVIGEIPRFCELVNYSQSFGFQWNTFSQTQLDNFANTPISEKRFYAETAWKPVDLVGVSVLEVGSGAGRFSEVLLRTTEVQLYSLDFSQAVEANWRNNSRYRNRFNLAQASIYEMPFPDNSFEKVFCFGVLQHTPSFTDSIAALVRKTRIDGEIVVDFYPINGWHTKFHTKYFLRPITKRLPKRILLWLVRTNIVWLIASFDLLCSCKLSVLTRFLPIADLRGFPSSLTSSQRIEWAVMDTFDAFSPQYDNPQRLEHVKEMFEKCGCRVTFAGRVQYDNGVATVVRAVRER
jgi:SAM-dependent methyltransferase